MTKITLYAKELADLYGLKTLYDYLIEEAVPLEFDFYSEEKKSILEKILQGAPITRSLANINIVTTYSDIASGCVGNRNLEIDLSILKNAAKPNSIHTKQQLRKRYRISPKKPVLILSYAVGDDKEYELIRDCSKLAKVIVVGGVSKSEGKAREAAASYITRYGVLKEHYAMADVAVNAALLWPSRSYLHNFVEATEGGPLFAVRPIRRSQFGYAELVKRNVISEFSEFKELKEALCTYLSDFKCNDNSVREQRARHLQETRKKYLPMLKQHLLHIFADGDMPVAGLNVEETGDMDTTGMVRLTHPSTQWGRFSVNIEYPMIAAHSKPGKSIFKKNQNNNVIPISQSKKYSWKSLLGYIGFDGVKQ